MLTPNPFITGAERSGASALINLLAVEATMMIAFNRMSFLERAKRFVSSEYRDKKERESKEAIRWLVKNPSAPCSIEGIVIDNGYNS